MNQLYDILIIGGGPIGATLAKSLSHLPLRIGLIEAKQITHDSRVLALTQVSKQIYTALNMWPKLAPHTTPIKHIHVSDRGHFGKTRFHAADVQLEALGYTIEMHHLQQALSVECDFICPAKIEAVTIEPQFATLNVKTPAGSHSLQTKLLIAADGADSFIRNTLKIDIYKHDYQQQALVTKVHFSDPHHNIAYERFTETGPLALLPLADKQAALVWVGKPERIQALKNSDAEIFLKALQQTFGYTLGKFVEVETRHHFPLSLVWAKEQVRSGVVIIGNANHSLHPIAAQGFNLGLRDVGMLAEVLSHNTAAIELNDFEFLQDYIRYREHDQSMTIHATDNLVQLFSHDFTPLTQARNLAMLALDLCPPIKRLFTRRAMGFTKNMSWLSVNS